MTNKYQYTFMKKPLFVMTGELKDVPKYVKNTLSYFDIYMIYARIACIYCREAYSVK